MPPCASHREDLDWSRPLLVKVRHLEKVFHDCLSPPLISSLSAAPLRNFWIKDVRCDRTRRRGRTTRDVSKGDKASKGDREPADSFMGKPLLFLRTQDAGQATAAARG